MAIDMKETVPTLLPAVGFTQVCDSRQGVYDKFKWGMRDAEIRNREGEVIFEQKKMLFPTNWSDTAVQIVAQKYFKGPLGSSQREHDLRQMVDRVVDRMATWGLEQGHFKSNFESSRFANELAYLITDQRVAFNSPVWFNVGTEFTTNPDKPQCSACFINKVDDNMESILQLYVKEGMIFKDGSGSGVNLSTLRSTREFLSGGGRPSGPVSFMRGFDVNAGQIKSGGKTRRAAKIVILNVDHPDIEDFIWAKAKEEKKIPALLAAGFSTEFNVANNAYDQIFFQNANNSVRVSDEFMDAATNSFGDTFWTKKVQSGGPCEKHNARDLLKQMAEAAWQCGDPGIQFDDTINGWNPVLHKARINASNPCSEYHFVDDSSCNLASLNLMKFRCEDGSFNSAEFAAAVHITVLAQDILVDAAGYPTPEITLNSHNYRPLGLGYANLGALLMVLGVPYDSDRGRDIAAAITSFMTAKAYQTSGRMASVLGAFHHFETGSFAPVVHRHADAAADLARHLDNTDGAEDPYALLANQANETWWEVQERARSSGFRNAQVTLLAPTGTIGFMMDCATTGIEPELALVKYKKLVGGGDLKLVNPEVAKALFTLGYRDEGPSILTYLENHGTLVSCPQIKIQHLPVFATSLGSTNVIEPMGHVKMMAAVQPFLSGAISKTVNLPEAVTVDDIVAIYRYAWKLGLKSVAVYRDGCKKSQPLTLTKQAAPPPAENETRRENPCPPAAPKQRKMPQDRGGVIHEFKIGDHKGFLTVGLYDDGTPGEIFVDISKEGSTISGLMDSWAITFSFALQYGVPLSKLVGRFHHMRFEPSGYTNSELGYAHSVVDYVVRWMERRFLLKDNAQIPLPFVEADRLAFAMASTPDAPPCAECGTLMTRNGSCYKCGNCGSTSGCS